MHRLSVWATSDPVGSYYYHHRFHYRFVCIGFFTCTQHCSAGEFNDGDHCSPCAAGTFSAADATLCAHLAWLTHFLDLEPVRAHPVSPEQHLFPSYVKYFLFQPHCMLNDEKGIGYMH